MPSSIRLKCVANGLPQQVAEVHPADRGTLRKLLRVNE